MKTNLTLNDLNLIAKLPKRQWANLAAELTAGQRREVESLRADLRRSK